MEMIDKIKEYINEANNFSTQNASDLEAFRIKFLGSKGLLKEFFTEFKYINSFQLNGFFEKEFTIEIENQDNQPLNLSKIKVLQNSLYVILDLKTNEKYEVVIDSTLSKPQYDIANFAFNSKDYPKATISNLTKIESEKENASEKPFWQSKAFMWICILFGIAIIGYFAMGLLKDMKKE